MTDRWATFDCYGTLIDWNGGIRRGLAGAFGEDRADALLVRYHELETELEADGRLTYRQVLIEAMRQLGASPQHEDVLARSLPDWEPFPEVKLALEEARVRGWRLAILSNTDRDYVEASRRRIGVLFDLAVVASEIGSYKPAHGHWQAFFAETDADRTRHVHVGASHVHDIVPADELGLRSVWINRLGERGAPRPTRELPDLSELPGTLDELVLA